MKENAPAELEEATKLLAWTTEKVLPTLLTTRKRAPLQELDLSRISFVNESMVTDWNESLDATSSPQFQLTPVGPPRKKGNRSATPERLEGNFDEIKRGINSKRKDSKVIPGDTAIHRMRCLTFGLLQSSCLVFSEWLSIGAGSGTKLNGILDEVMKWFSIFDSNACIRSDEGDGQVVPTGWNDVHLDILPTFARLCLIICVQTEEFNFFEQFLSTCLKLLRSGANERVEWIGGIVQKLVSKLLKSKPSEAESPIAPVVTIVLEGAYSVLGTAKASDAKDESMATVGESLALPSNMQEAVCCDDNNPGCVIGLALEVVSKHKQASMLLAQKVFENFSRHIHSPNEGNDPDVITEDDPSAAKRKETAEVNADTECPNGDSSDDSTSKVLFEAKCLYLLGGCRKEPAMKEILREVASLDRSNMKYFFSNSPLTVVVEQMLTGVE